MLTGKTTAQYQKLLEHVKLAVQRNSARNLDPEHCYRLWSKSENCCGNRIPKHSYFRMLFPFLYFSVWYRPTRSSMHRRAVEELMSTCTKMHRRMATVFCRDGHKLCYDVRLPRTRWPSDYSSLFTADATPVGLWRLCIGLLMGSLLNQDCFHIFVDNISWRFVTFSSH